MRLVILMVMAYAISGCSWLVHDRTNDYLKAEIHPNIVVPKDVALVKLTPRLAIPDVDQKPLPEEFEVPRPEKIKVLADAKDDSVLASKATKNVTAELLKDGNGTPILRLNVNFAQAWSELAETIKLSNISITDLNRSVGTYYVEVVDSNEFVEPGFWGSLFGVESEPVKKALQLKVNRARSGVYVAVHIDQDNLAEDDEARALLSKLQATLQESQKDNS